jgi:hypothetical protein
MNGTFKIQIEPTIGPSTSSPESLTYGLEYDGSGELYYLDILRYYKEPRRRIDRRFRLVVELVEWDVP